MTIKQSQNPYGYRNLLAYKKAEELQLACSELTRKFPKTKTLAALADQMNRSARSTKQNIVEGWKRNSTKEYYEFLGFAIASNAELEEDCGDIWKGIYLELMGIKGVMGEMGLRGEMGEKGSHLSYLSPLTPSSPSSPLTPSAPSDHPTSSTPLTPLTPFIPFDIEKIPFYPLNPHLSPIVRLKLRAKELNFLLDRLQKSLLDKMGSEGTLSVADKFQKRERQRRGEEKWFKDFLAGEGLVRLEDGRFVKKGEKGLKGEMGEKGGREEMGEMGVMGEKGEMRDEKGNERDKKG